MFLSKVLTFSHFLDRGRRSNTIRYYSYSDVMMTALSTAVTVTAGPQIKYMGNICQGRSGLGRGKDHFKDVISWSLLKF